MKKVLFFLCILLAGCNDNYTINQISFNKIEKIKVDIQGHVKRPGLYLVNRNTYFSSVIKMAGGYLNNAEKVNDYKVKNNITIFINKNTTNKIDLNKASDVDLMKIKGIGKSLASKIISFRQKYGEFTNVSQLKEIKGIKDKLFNKIYMYFKV